MCGLSHVAALRYCGPLASTARPPGSPQQRLGTISAMAIPKLQRLVAAGLNQDGQRLAKFP